MMRARWTALVLRLGGLIALIEAAVLMLDAARAEPLELPIQALVLDAGYAVQPEHLVRSLAAAAAWLIIGLVLLGGSGSLSRWLWRGLGRPGADEMEHKLGDAFVAIFSGLALVLLSFALFGVTELAGTLFLARLDPDPARYVLAHLARPLVTLLSAGSGSLWLLPRIRLVVRRQLGLVGPIETGPAVANSGEARAGPECEATEGEPDNRPIQP